MPDPGRASTLTLFLCGDVMTGRGIDQVLPHPVDPVLYESYVKDARGYVQLAEKVNGPIPRPVDYAYIWGDALAELERFRPDVRLINLETGVTTSEDKWEGKEIHYRMHPANVPCLAAAKIDCCALGNNHVLDWGYRGLAETLATLERAGLAGVGAGQDVIAARRPAAFARPEGSQVIVFSLGLPTSGIPLAWRATAFKPGVNLLTQLSEEAIANIAQVVAAYRQAGSVVVASIHWGSNWGYDIPAIEQELAHRLIDAAGVDVVHGHSSHHVKGIEVYRERLILYGCGDLLTDYEGIAGHETFRGDLSLLYFPEVDPATGHLLSLTMTPTQMRRFQLQRAGSEAGAWLEAVLNREGKRLNTRVECDQEGRLHLLWGSDRA